MENCYITDREGRITQHTEYIAFGEVLFEEHSTSKTMPYLFNGKELDSETGLYYYGARYYDPKVSIFVNVDPLVEKTMQPYAYVNNNPVMLIDPTGMIWEKPKEAERLSKSIKDRIEDIKQNTIKIENEIKAGKSKFLLFSHRLNEKQILSRKDKIAENNMKIKLLNQSLTDIEAIGNATDTYRLTSPSQNDGTHSVIKGEDNVINIEGSNDGLYIHEIRHIGQSMEAGGLKFNKNGQLINPANTYKVARKNEVKAYQTQYSFDNSYPERANSLKDINEKSLMKIKKEDGTKVYQHLENK